MEKRNIMTSKTEKISVTKAKDRQLARWKERLKVEKRKGNRN